MQEIRVTVVKYPDRPFLVMRYVDPMTGKQKARSTKAKTKREAERAAAKWEAELREGRYCDPSRTTWQDFREKYENEVLSSLAAETDSKVCIVFGFVESIVSPARLRDLTAERLSYFQSKLRDGGRAESTIESYLAHLKAALNWAVSMGLLPKAPDIKRPKRAKGGKVMKGRPVTGEEFDRMLDRAERVVGIEAAASWRHYLRGLWLSGLRLEESLELWWDRDDRLCVDLGGKRPMLRIPGAMEKGNQDRLLPMAPEFAEFLQQTPEGDRTGRVFNPQPKRRYGERLTRDRVSRLVSDIGEAAGVKVNTDASGKVKYASAHDLRRSFGERWASKIMPTVLQQLMRHESIETTLRYYVGRNAENTADVLWAAHEQRKGNKTGNSGTCEPLTVDASA